MAALGNVCFREMRLMFFLCLLFACAFATCMDDVQEAANQVINDPLFYKAQWRMEFVALENSGVKTTLFSHDETKFSTPASNNKIPTTSTAFTLLGANHTFSTNFFFGSSEVCIVSGGDSSLSTEQLSSFAKEVSRKLTSTSSSFFSSSYHVVVDDSLFGPQDVPGGWEYGDMNYDYGAPPSASVLDHNVVSLLVSPSQVGNRAIIRVVSESDNGTITWVNEG